MSAPFSFYRHSGEGLPYRHSGESSPTRHPAKAGIHFAFALGANAKTASRPCVVSPAIHGGRVTFFACPKKVTQERAPSRSRSRGHPCPRDRASRLRGLPTARPCADGKLAGILPAIAARLFLHLLAATWRGPGGAKESAAPAAGSFGFAALDVDPSVKRRRSAGRGRVRRTRCGPGRPAFGDRAGALPPNPGRPQRTGAQRRRFTEGAFLWLLSLCKQRK